MAKLVILSHFIVFLLHLHLEYENLSYLHGLTFFFFFVMLPHQMTNILSTQIIGIATTRPKLVIETILLLNTRLYQKVFFNQKTEERLVPGKSHVVPRNYAALGGD